MNGGQWDKLRETFPYTKFLEWFDSLTYMHIWFINFLKLILSGYGCFTMLDSTVQQSELAIYIYIYGDIYIYIYPLFFYFFTIQVTTEH